MSVDWVPLLEVLAACAVSALLAGRQARRQATQHDRLALVVDLLAEELAEEDDERAASGMMARLAGLMGADSGTLGIPVGDRLAVVGSYGLSGPSRWLHPGEGYAGRCWVQGRPIVMGNLDRDPDYVEGGGVARSGAYVPARSEGRVTAVLALESSREKAFSARDLRVLQPVADLVGSVVESRRRARTAENLEHRLLPMVSAATAAPLHRLEASLDMLLSSPVGDAVTRPDADRRAQGALALATTSARELERIVGSLDASVVDSVLDARPVPAAALLKTLARAAADQGRPALAVDCPLQVSVLVDETRLVPALTAILLTHDGTLPLRASLVGTDVVLTLPGDPLALSAHVCHRLVERLGGLLAAGISPGTVVLTLPVARPTPAVVPFPALSDTTPRHRLLRLLDPSEVG